eukprot:scaffold533_cov369-Prasinococcus_capsulatus_cf.AAC.8
MHVPCCALDAASLRTVEQSRHAGHGPAARGGWKRDHGSARARAPGLARSGGTVHVSRPVASRLAALASSPSPASATSSCCSCCRAATTAPPPRGVPRRLGRARNVRVRGGARAGAAGVCDWRTSGACSDSSPVRARAWRRPRARSARAYVCGRAPQVCTSLLLSSLRGGTEEGSGLLRCPSAGLSARSTRCQRSVRARVCESADGAAANDEQPQNRGVGARRPRVGTRSSRGHAGAGRQTKRRLHTERKRRIPGWRRRPCGRLLLALQWRRRGCQALQRLPAVGR